jgi:surface polysaccharide O-acyltransferase-like enzyme
MKNKRVAGLDIIRALAVLFVISVHYFKNTIFYSIPMTGKTMIILNSLRWLFFICVPLFMILTGYLSRNKEPNKEYFKGIKKVLISYLFISIACIIVRIFYFKEKQRILYWLISPFNFTADGYSWYIEMYIGLFLIAPFLNILYKNLKDKKQKELLIIVLLILTGVPAMFNNYNILGLNKIKIFPNWWIDLYPITYYYIGSYIAEYKPKIKLSKGILYTTLICFLQGLLHYLLCDKKSFSWNIYGGYGSIITVIISIIVFITFYDKDIKNKFLNKIVTIISLTSLDIYLLSFLVDKLFYPYIKTFANTPKKVALLLIPTIIIVFSISFILAFIKKVLFDIIEKTKSQHKISKKL